MKICQSKRGGENRERVDEGGGDKEDNDGGGVTGQLKKRVSFSMVLCLPHHLLITPPMVKTMVFHYVILMICDRELEHFLDEAILVSSQTIADDNGELIVNHAYRAHKKQDARWHIGCFQQPARRFYHNLWSLRPRLLSRIMTLLNGVPIKFEPFVTAITVSREPYTFETMTSILMDVESRIRDTMRTPISINMARHDRSNNNKNGGRTDDNRGKSQSNNRYKGRSRHQCELCGKLGHLVDKCWHRFDKEFKGVGSQRSQSNSDVQANGCKYSFESVETCYNPFASPSAGLKVADNRGVQINQLPLIINSLIAKGFLNVSERWFPNSRATHHVIYERLVKSSALEYKGKGKVYLGDDSTLNISHINDTVLSAGAFELRLDHALFIPQITRNLISVSRFTRDNNIYIEFHSKKCFVKDEVSGFVRLEVSTNGVKASATLGIAWTAEPDQQSSPEIAISPSNLGVASGDQQTSPGATVGPNGSGVAIERSDSVFGDVLAVTNEAKIGSPQKLTQTRQNQPDVACSEHNVVPEIDTGDSLSRCEQRLKGDLKEEVYMRQLDGFESRGQHGERFVCKLIRRKVVHTAVGIFLIKENMLSCLKNTCYLPRPWTHPYLIFAVHKVAQFMQQPCEAHCTAVKRIFRCLKGTLNFGSRVAPQHGQFCFEHSLMLIGVVILIYIPKQCRRESRFLLQSQMMVAAFSHPSTPSRSPVEEPNTHQEQTSTSTTKRSPLKDNGSTVTRKPRGRKVSSRYMSSSPSTSSSSSSSSSSSATTTMSAKTTAAWNNTTARYPSPFISRSTNATSTSTPTSTTLPSVPTRSQSVDRRRPRGQASHGNNANSTELSAASKMLITSIRSLSVSFQGEAFSLPISKTKTQVVPCSTRKVTPERRRATPVRDHGDNSKPLDQLRWPGRTLQGNPVSGLNPLSISLDSSCERRMAGSGAMLAKSLLQSIMLDESSRSASFDGASRLSLDLGSAAEFSKEPNKQNPDVNSTNEASFVPYDLTASDTDSLSSGSTNSGKQDYGGTGISKGRIVPRNIAVSTKCWQETSSWLRRLQDPSLPLSTSPGSRIGASAKFSQSKRFSSDAACRLHGQWLLLSGEVQDPLLLIANAREDATFMVQKLSAKIAYLEAWAILDIDHSSALLGATEALKASVLRLLVVGKAIADIQNLKDAVCSAVDVMQATTSSICLLSSKVKFVN
ncbi:QWRF motif-containing protein 2 [Hibiscus syriacus]|uniref:QWRF motif-containing protein 2 n=1 Tax=Hibiscus syriacus TaxID=106335 RepID=A0A6A3AUA5_HIBSY|nr:QWRF motif-containing protein 2 [Hibiscus syriacus]